MRDDPTICMLGDPSRTYPGRQASWIHIYNNGKYDELEAVNLKIYSAFEGIKSFPFKRIIFQFWRPQAEGGRRVLESSRNAYAFSPLDRLLKNKYRGRCMKYKYSIDEGEDNPAWIIRGGPVPAAFLNRFPEVVLDLTVHRGSPLVDYGLECELTCCVMVPVFYGGSSECLGVVECSMKHHGLLLPIYYELKCELERVGFSIFHLQGSWPYKTISGDLEAVKIEIENALEIACESHALTLGQVWIPYKSDGSQMLLVKLSGYSVGSDDNPLSSIKDFYVKFDVIPLKTREGLVWKTLQTHQPHLCRNIYKLSDNKGILALLFSNTKSKCASFVICLRSTHTGDLDYAFEFFWPLGRNHFILLETLLLTLRSYLPSFKCASSEQLGDEIIVVDVENSSTSTPVKIFPGNRLSETRRAGMKRKSIAGQSELNKSNQYPLITNPEGDDEDGDGDDDLAIIATYRNQNLLLYLPSSSIFENVMEKLKNEFELDPAQTYKVEFEVVPGQWSSLVCLESCRRIEDMGVIKLRVVPNRKEAGLRWITNS